MPAPLEVHSLCLLGIMLAVYVSFKLKYRLLAEHLPYLLLFGISGIPDMLATVEFAYLRPELEANILARMFLGIPYLMPIGVFLWVLVWLSIAEFLGRKSSILPKIVLGGLFIGHLLGVSTWIKYMDLSMLLLMFAVSAFVLGIMLVMVNAYGKVKQQ
ncbi:MAG: hypothetical protein QXS93_04625 [Candidatus Micrarchaeia archaeon]